MYGKVYPWHRKNVTILTYGSAHIKPFFGAKETIHVHRSYDFVSDFAGLRLYGAGQDYTLNPLTNILGLTNSTTSIIPAGNVEGLSPYTHSFEMSDLNGNSVGYSSDIPKRLHQLINKLK